MTNIQIQKLPQVMALTGLSRSSIYAFIQKNTFPKPIRLGERAVGWLSSEIENWIAEQAQKRGCV